LVKRDWVKRVGVKWADVITYSMIDQDWFLSRQTINKGDAIMLNIACIPGENLQT